MADDEYTHLDVFSGLGGFAIAAREAGFRTVAFCESDTHCQRFLERAWGLPVHTDIRGLDGRQHRGVSLLTGGPPCQPASRAGKRQGAADDRWLWPEALRVLEEAMPDSVVFENPPGIYDVGIDGILSEMERIGYEVQPFDIPACSVDSPQLRYRVWIVGFLMGESHGDRCQEGKQTTAITRHGDTTQSATSSILADAARDSERRIREETGANVERTRATIERELADATICEDDRRRNGNMAEAQGRRRGGDATDRSISESVVADSECGGFGARSWEQTSVGLNGHTSDNVAGAAGARHEGRVRGRELDEPAEGREKQVRSVAAHSAGELGDTEIERGGTGLCEKRPEQNGNGTSGSTWSNFVWVPCADGKFRRAPNESVDVVNGLHRSVLAALGNAIVPQVAVQILRAIKIVIASPNVGD
jgi:site-specific DNA-cytosine methylase